MIVAVFVDKVVDKWRELWITVDICCGFTFFKGVRGTSCVSILAKQREVINRFLCYPQGKKQVINRIYGISKGFFLTPSCVLHII